MIKIKDYIFNENEIEYIKKELEGIIVCPKAVNVELKAIENATFEDIEWNYENNNEYCNVFYEDRIKELEEENKTLKESLGEMTKRNVKATVYIEKNSSAFNGEEEHLDKVYTILKGEENENN